MSLALGKETLVVMYVRVHEETVLSRLWTTGGREFASSRIVCVVGGLLGGHMFFSGRLFVTCTATSVSSDLLFGEDKLAMIFF